MIAPIDGPAPRQPASLLESDVVRVYGELRDWLPNTPLKSVSERALNPPPVDACGGFCFSGRHESRIVGEIHTVFEAALRADELLGQPSTCDSVRDAVGRKTLILLGDLASETGPRRRRADPALPFGQRRFGCIGLIQLYAKIADGV